MWPILNCLEAQNSLWVRFNSLTFCVIYEVCGWGLPNTVLSDLPGLAQKWFVIWSFTHLGIIICYSEQSTCLRKDFESVLADSWPYYNLIRIQNWFRILVDLMTNLICPGLWAAKITWRTWKRRKNHDLLQMVKKWLRVALWMYFPSVVEGNNKISVLPKP